jgi:hypothetical protein
MLIEQVLEVYDEFDLVQTLQVNVHTAKQPRGKILSMRNTFALPDSMDWNQWVRLAFGQDEEGNYIRDRSGLTIMEVNCKPRKTGSKKANNGNGGWMEYSYFQTLVEEDITQPSRVDAEDLKQYGWKPSDEEKQMLAGTHVTCVDSDE